MRDCIDMMSIELKQNRKPSSILYQLTWSLPVQVMRSIMLFWIYWY